MGTSFDPDDGVLRVRHGALAVLALLATDPASTRLHDHGVAPLLAELRSAGLVGAQGVHSDVAPLAAAIGRARATADLFAHDHGRPRRARGWISDALAVVGVATEDDPHTYELMADAPDRLPELLEELVGLGTAPAPPVPGRQLLNEEAFDALLAADTAVTGPAVQAALAPGESQPVAPEDTDAFAAALTDGLRGAAVRWRLTARPTGVEQPSDDIDVLDAGSAGLWLARRGPEGVTIGAVDAAEVRAELRALTTLRLRRPGTSKSQRRSGAT